MVLDRIPDASEIINLPHYRDVAAGRVKRHELAYNWPGAQKVPNCRAAAMDEGLTQGFFCMMAGFGILPSPPVGTPDNLLPYFVEGIILGAEQASMQMHAEHEAAMAAERERQQESNVFPFRRR